MRRLTSVLLLACIAACAHLPPPPGSDEEARSAANLYLKVLRWEGPRASATLLVPELQREYLDTVKDKKLERTLKITEYDLKETGRKGKDTVDQVAQVAWYFEPEVTVHDEEITLHLLFRDGKWMVAGVEGGPIPIRAIGAPEPAADGGAP